MRLVAHATEAERGREAFAADARVDPDGVRDLVRVSVRVRVRVRVRVATFLTMAMNCALSSFSPPMSGLNLATSSWLG